LGSISLIPSNIGHRDACGNGLTEEALWEKGFVQAAEAVHNSAGEALVTLCGLVADMHAAMRKHLSIEKLRFLLYPKGLSKADLARIQADEGGVVWLWGMPRFELTMTGSRARALLFGTGHDNRSSLGGRWKGEWLIPWDHHRRRWL